MSEFIESYTPPPDSDRSNVNAFSDDDVITRTLKSYTPIDAFKPIATTAISKFYTANEAIKEQQEQINDLKQAIEDLKN